MESLWSKSCKVCRFSVVRDHGHYFGKDCTGRSPDGLEEICRWCKKKMTIAEIQEYERKSVAPGFLPAIVLVDEKLDEKDWIKRSDLSEDEDRVLMGWHRSGREVYVKVKSAVYRVIQEGLTYWMKPEGFVSLHARGVVVKGTEVEKYEGEKILNKQTSPLVKVFGCIVIGERGTVEDSYFGVS